MRGEFCPHELSFHGQIKRIKFYQDMSMNEQAINEIMEGVIKGVINQLKTEAPHVSVSSGAGGPVPVELSARHVHLSEQDALELFGKPLTPVRELSQPGQFLCEERVRLIGPKGVMDNVAVLGPARPASQVEISNTEARTLGIKAPVRQSGDIAKGLPASFSLHRPASSALMKVLSLPPVISTWLPKTETSLE